MIRRHNAPRPSDLSIREVIAPFLALTGWSERLSTNGKWRVFHSHSSSPQETLEVVLPTQAENRDAPHFATRAIEIIAALNQEQVDMAALRVAMHDSDVLFIRNSKQVVAESIELAIAATQIPALNRGIVYAVCSEKQPRPYFMRAPDRARSLLRTLQFGHTFAGSFGYTIRSRIVGSPTHYQAQFPIFDQPAVPPLAPFERRIIERVIRGLQNTSQAMSELSVRPLVEGYGLGFNGNSCKHFSDVYRSEVGPVGCEVLWSPKISPASDVESPGPLYITEKASEFLKEAEEDLKIKKPVEDRVTGTVALLATKGGQSPMEEDSLRYIAVQGILEHTGSGKSNLVYVDGLSASDYDLAIQAHREHRIVTIRGILSRRYGGTGSWRLSGARMERP